MCAWQKSGKLSSFCDVHVRMTKIWQTKFCAVHIGMAKIWKLSSVLCLWAWQKSGKLSSVLTPKYSKKILEFCVFLDFCLFCCWWWCCCVGVYFERGWGGSKSGSAGSKSYLTWFLVPSGHNYHFGTPDKGPVIGYPFVSQNDAGGRLCPWWFVDLWENKPSVLCKLIMLNNSYTHA